MERVENFVYYITQRLSDIGQAALVFIMLLIVGNVALRYFWSPILGTYEIVEILGALFLATGAAYASATKSHIAVDFAVEKLSPIKQCIIDIIHNTISFFFMVFICWGLWIYAGDMYQRSRETTSLHIPLYPVLYLVCFGIGLVALVILIYVLTLFAAMIKKGGRKE